MNGNFEKIYSKQKSYPNKDNSLELITLFWPSLSIGYMSIYELFAVSKWYIIQLYDTKIKIGIQYIYDLHKIKVIIIS